MARPKRMDFWRGKAVMYRCYDKTGRLLYVGSTINMPRRMSDHRQAAWWMPLVIKTRMQVFPTVEAARAAESLAIQEKTPLCNIVGTGRSASDKSFPLWTRADRAMAEAFSTRWMQA